MDTEVEENSGKGGLATLPFIIGAVVSDSYLGRRFRDVAIGSISSFVGMFIFWLTAMIPQLTPSPCSQSQHVCNGPTEFQLAVLFSSFGIMSIGNGFVTPCSIIFGADQLGKKDDTDNKRLMDSYFNWYYATVIPVTVIAYIQEHYGWKVGFGIPVLLMLISAAIFLIGSPLYIKVKPKESLFIGLLQAAVAVFTKRSTTHPSTYNEDYY